MSGFSFSLQEAGRQQGGRGAASRHQELLPRLELRPQQVRALCFSQIPLVIFPCKTRAKGHAYVWQMLWLLILECGALPLTCDLRLPAGTTHLDLVSQRTAPSLAGLGLAGHLELQQGPADTGDGSCTVETKKLPEGLGVQLLLYTSCCCNYAQNRAPLHPSRYCFPAACSNREVLGGQIVN